MFGVILQDLGCKSVNSASSAGLLQQQQQWTNDLYRKATCLCSLPYAFQNDNDETQPGTSSSNNNSVFNCNVPEESPHLDSGLRNYSLDCSAAVCLLLSQAVDEECHSRSVALELSLFLSSRLQHTTKTTPTTTDAAGVYSHPIAS